MIELFVKSLRNVWKALENEISKLFRFIHAISPYQNKIALKNLKFH